MASDPVRAFLQAMTEVTGAINDCLHKGRALPCLMLLYSAIDVLASLERSPGETIGEAFARWVEKYMLPSAALGFTGVELFAARCGIVHSFSAESDLSRAGRARKIVYAWGTADVEALKKVTQALGRSEISVHLRDVLDAFGNAVVRYIDDVADHPTEHRRFFESTSQWLMSVEPNAFNDFLALHEAI